MAVGAAATDDQPTNRLPAVKAGDDEHGSRFAALSPARSLRTRLILAFASLICLTLILVGTGFLFVLRQYQEQRELLRLGGLMGPILAQARQIDQQGRSLDDATDFLNREADELDVRLVLARPNGAVYFDSDNDLLNHRIDLLAPRQIGIGPGQRARLVEAPGIDDPGLRFIYLQPGADRPIIRANAPVLAIVHEPTTILSVLREMAPRLGLAAAGSLFASTVVAWLLAASIARPLARMTHAAEDMAHGRFDHEIDGRGSDEVARLAAAFNTMVREVARSQRTLRDFVANVSHDLRTPLTSIQGFSQAMVEGALHTPDDYADAGRVINEEAERMRRLVEDLLDLSKIESGQVRLSLEPCDLAAMTRQLVERVERRTSDTGVGFSSRIDAVPPVLADARWVERAIDNLVDNALKHTPVGGIVTIVAGTVTVPAGARHGPAITRRSNEFGYIAIHNTGSFIPPEDQSRVFERFYQLDKARSGSGAGSGLGLAIAQEIMQAHGGWIDVQSSRVGGTEFAVLLPALDRPAGRGVASGRSDRVSVA
jgi:signal transduction histidine kinase